MLNFNIGSLAAWIAVSPGEMVEFPVMEGSPRDCVVDFLSDAPVSIRAVAENQHHLLAFGEGLIQVKFTISQPTAVVVLAHKDTLVFMRTRVAAQVIPESQEAAYTSIEPRPAGPSQDVLLMQRIMRQNNLRNQQLLAEQRLAYEQRFGELEGRLSRPAVAPAGSADVIDGGDADAG